MNKAVLLTVALIFFIGTVSAATNESTSTDPDIFRGDLESLSVGDTSRVIATVGNLLPQDDSIKLEIRLRAPQNIILFTVDPSPGVSCSTPANTPRPDHECFITVANESQKDVNLTVEAMANGQGTLIATVNSTITNLGNTDELEINIRPKYARQSVSAPGITFLHMILAGLFAGTVLFFARKD